MRKIIMSILVVLCCIGFMGCGTWEEGSQAPTPTPIVTSTPAPVVTPEPKPTGLVTLEQYEQLKEGMSLSQVEDILGYGELGTIDGEYKVYTWDSTARYVAIKFKNDIVVDFRWI